MAMVEKLLLLPVYLPVKAIGKTAEFIVWDVLSDGCWKARRTKPVPSLRWQNEALQAQRSLREQDARYRRQLQEQEQQYLAQDKKQKRG